MAEDVEARGPAADQDSGRSGRFILFGITVMRSVVAAVADIGATA